MAAYFPGQPEIQQESLQTLYLMNPSFAGYSDPTSTQHIFFNNSLTPTIPQQQQQHFVGIPLHPPQHSVTPRPIHYSPWPGPSPSPDTNSLEFELQLDPRQQQGLSLSLSPQQQSGRDNNGPKAAGLQSLVIGSKYLKVAQQLLDEVANVGNTTKDEAVVTASTTKDRGKEPEDGGGGDGSGKRAAADLSTAERQEIQMKKAKLVSMLDEVEQRYRQYRQHMQTVVSSFEAVAGTGSARSYTSLALLTISKQFRCLRDAITVQIRVASKSLGEEEEGGRSSRLRLVDHQLRQQRAMQNLGMIQHSAWRPQRGLPERAVSVLRAWLFEHFLHPYPKDSEKHMLAKQTGLTRSQVSNWFINARVRLWKPMVEEMYLEETKQQQAHDNNGDDDNKSSKSESNNQSAPKSASQQLSSPSRTEHYDEGLNSTQNRNLNPDHSSGFESMIHQSMKRARSDEQIHQNTIPNLMSMGMDMKSDELGNRELLMKFMGQGGGYGTYPIGEIARLEHEQFSPRFGANGVSLTLRLPYCETLSLSGSQQPPSLSNERLGMRSEEGNYFSLNNDSNNRDDPSNLHTPNGYESISIESRKRFAAQLLPDYVT